ncbi:hypothetical protein HBH75_166030 [Parastagonospora nodorum]|nr:hypothetical protein HBH75_166030 [Parastagonospora nodorum]KAH5401502.1 hypothetical protein HBI32_171570 [Parastagonospora nodorum]
MSALNSASYTKPTIDPSAIKLCTRSAVHTNRPQSSWIHLSTAIQLTGIVQWVEVDDEHPACEPRALHLCGRRLIPDLEAHVTQNQKLAFIVFKNYRCSHDQMMGKNAELERSVDSIYLRSQELCTGLREVFGKTSLRLAQLNQFRPKAVLQAPYLWYYDSREELNLKLDGSDATLKRGQSVEALLDVVPMSMAEEYSVVDALLAQKTIQWEYMGYLYRVGDVVLQSNNKDLDHCQAYEVLSTQLTGSGGGPIDRIVLELRTWGFDGTFKQVDSRLSIALSRFESEATLPVTALPAIPIQYAEHDVTGHLTRRGRMYYKLRNKGLVAYTGSVVGSDTYLHQRRFMIDTSMYKQIRLGATDGQEDTMRSEPDAASTLSEEIPKHSFLLMLPASIHGYDLLDKRWSQLLVSNISDVKWNAELFKQVILPPREKNLLEAVVKWPISDASSSVSSGVRGGQHTILLHGSPGSGKTFTAEAIAEMTERPLFRISYSDIGTNAPKAKEHLQFVSKLCNTWGCVVLFDDIGDKEQIALVTAVLHSLDVFTGIVILSTNLLGRFDRALIPRIRLIIRFERWSQNDREKAWQNILERLNVGMDNQSAKFLERIPFLAKWEQNGWEMDSTIKTAIQLAHAQNEPLNKSHLKKVANNLEAFQEYIGGSGEGNW